MLVAPVFRRIFQDVRRKQCIACQFDINRRIVFVALDRVQFQQREVQIILDNFKICPLFFVQRRWIQSIDATLKAFVKLSLGLDARRAVVVEHFVKCGAIVLVISGLCSADWRKSQAAVQEIISKFVEVGYARSVI